MSTEKVKYFIDGGSGRIIMPEIKDELPIIDNDWILKQINKIERIPRNEWKKVIICPECNGSPKHYK